jgi:magnesium chelatase subunit H
MQKHTTAGSTVKVVIVTLDHHLASAVGRVNASLAKILPGFSLTLHAASDWAAKPALLKSCLDDLASANVVIANMLFMEEHVNAVLPTLQAKRDGYNALAVFMSAGEAIKLTRVGKFDMGAKQSSFMSLLKKLKGSKSDKASSGERQMAMLKRLPQVLRWIPGTAQDVRAYFVAMQYWLAGSEENVDHLIPAKLPGSGGLSSQSKRPDRRRLRRTATRCQRWHRGPAADALLCAVERFWSL